jgi:hypothetical protein
MYIVPYSEAPLVGPYRVTHGGDVGAVGVRAGAAHVLLDGFQVIYYVRWMGSKWRK